MCNESRTTLEETDNGTIHITIDPNDVWNMLSDENKELLIEEAGTWHIIRQNLKFNLQRGVSSDNFLPSIQRLRELIATDSDFVPDVVAACIKQLLEDKATAIQEKREAEQAFWRLRNLVTEHFRDQLGHRPEWAQNIQSGYDINRDDDFMRFSTADVKKEVLQAFFEALP